MVTRRRVRRRVRLAYLKPSSWLVVATRSMKLAMWPGSRVLGTRKYLPGSSSRRRVTDRRRVYSVRSITSTSECSRKLRFSSTCSTRSICSIFENNRTNQRPDRRQILNIYVVVCTE